MLAACQILTAEAVVDLLHKREAKTTLTLGFYVEVRLLVLSRISYVVSH